MRDADFKNVDATRALQASEATRRANLAFMATHGPYSLLKVKPWGDREPTVRNYVTVLPAISGATPRMMEDILGLRRFQLVGGADIYRLLELPSLNGFLPRGYTTLVEGLELRDGLRQDRHGYRPGHGAFQITLIEPVKAQFVKRLGPDEPFEPGIHPSLRHLYPPATR